MATYLSGPRGPECRIDSDNVATWYLFDGLGSVVGEVDASGDVKVSRKYDVYGFVRGSTGSGVSKHKFVGSLGHVSEDETGLIYMRARYMDPALGRFISEDPAKQGRNWYAYARNDPVNSLDPDGEFAQLLVLGVPAATIVAAAILAVAAAVLLYYTAAVVVGNMDMSVFYQRSREEDKWHAQRKREALEKWREEVDRWIEQGMEGPKPKPKYPQRWRKGDRRGSEGEE